MKKALTRPLKKLGLYHPLQSAYRAVLRSLSGTWYRIQYRGKSGKGHACNFCNQRFEKFIPSFPAPENAAAIEKHHVVAGYGAKIICPNCQSTARERLARLCLDHFIHPAGKKILHISPERKLSPYLRSVADVISADLQPGFYRDIDPSVQMVDLTKMDFSNGQFDLVIANHVLEHISNDRDAMLEIFRVLKPGGRAVLQVPYSTKLSDTIESAGISDPCWQSAMYGQEDHVRIYALDDYMFRLEEAGFHVKVVQPGELLRLSDVAQQPEECFLLVTKPA